MSAVEQAEHTAREAIIAQEAESWEKDILGYYRAVAASYNKKVEAEYAPLFEALLRNASRPPA